MLEKNWRVAEVFSRVVNARSTFWIMAQHMYRNGPDIGVSPQMVCLKSWLVSFGKATAFTGVCWCFFLPTVALHVN